MIPSILVEHHPVNASGRHLVRALLRIEGTAPTDEQRIPLNLSVVLDRSGSMAGEKLYFARQAANQLLAGVHPDDVTSVVTFESDVEVVARAAPRGTQTDLSRRVAALTVGGMTNLSGGWLEGRAQVEVRRSPDRSNRVVLMTDGRANVGITDPRAFSTLVAEARRQGVTTTTIGFGQDYDEHFLEMLADAGGGNAYYVEHPDQAPDVFAAEMDELLGLSAQNIVVEVELEPGVELGAVHHAYPREDVGRTLRLRLGDLYASEPKLLLVELLVQVPTTPEQDESPLMKLRIEGDVLGEGGAVERQTVFLPVSFDPVAGPVVHAEVSRTLVFLKAASARRAAMELERRGRHDEAARALRASALHVRDRVKDADGVEEVEDLERMADHLERRTYTAQEAKYMASRSWGGLRSKASSKEILSRSRRERTRPSRTRPVRERQGDRAAGAVGRPDSSAGAAEGPAQPEGDQMTMLPLHLLCDHLFLEVAGGHWLLDTGAPTSFGDLDALSIAGERFKIQESYVGMTAKTLSEAVRVPCRGLLGADVLGRFDWILDIPSGTASMSPGELRPSGTLVHADSFMGIPIVSVTVRDHALRMFFDTGAQISYLQDDVRSSFPSSGTLVDFYPGFGRFETETHAVTLALGDMEQTVRCGELPGILGMTLAAAGTQGILGLEIIRGRCTGYAPRRGLIWLGGAPESH